MSQEIDPKLPLKFFKYFAGIVFCMIWFNLGLVKGNILLLFLYVASIIVCGFILKYGNEEAKKSRAYEIMQFVVTCQAIGAFILLIGKGSLTSYWR